MTAGRTAQRVLAALVAIAIVGASAFSAHACSPLDEHASPKLLASLAARAEHVFLGTVVEVEAVAGRDEGRVSFRIERVYKGAPSKDVTYRYLDPSVYCQYWKTRRGHRNVFFLYRREGELWVHSAPGVTPIRIAEAMRLLAEKERQR